MDVHRLTPQLTVVLRDMLSVGVQYGLTRHNSANWGSGYGYSDSMGGGGWGDGFGYGSSDGNGEGATDTSLLVMSTWEDE